MQSTPVWKNWVKYKLAARNNQQDRLAINVRIEMTARKKLIEVALPLDAINHEVKCGKPELIRRAIV